MSRASTSLAAVLVTVAAAACGGGGGSASFGGGIGGTGIVVGVINGLGSVIVEDVEFDTAGAEITVDGEPATESDLALGMVVTVEGTVNEDGTTGTAESIEFESLVEGPVRAVDQVARTAVVLGDTIRLGDDTVLEGFDLDPSRVGEVVRVSGFVDTTAALRATRVEQRPQPPLFFFSGTVRDLDPEAQTFRIRRVVVDFASAQLSGVPAGGLRNGLTARVGTSSPPSGGVVTADRIHVREVAIVRLENERVLVRGAVSEVIDASRFILSDLVLVRLVDATVFVNGSRDDLAPDALIGVLGRVTRTRAIVAERIGFLDELAPAP